jgi:hypothetical protein
MERFAVALRRGNGKEQATACSLAAKSYTTLSELSRGAPLSSNFELRDALRAYWLFFFVGQQHGA